MSFLPFAQSVAAVLQLKTNDVTVVLELLAEGATIPFIARYRKDKTGGLDEVQIQSIADEAKLQKEFAERKAFIEKTISEQGKMTEALQAKINAAQSIASLEDIYLPYKPKRKTKAQTAITIAKSFIGQPYKAGTLEGKPKEQLVCNLRDFDCSTFVETVVAMSLINHAGSPSFEKFKKQLTELRYRNGSVEGYASRLHYFREWIIQAERNNILQDITSKIGGLKQKKNLNFMTHCLPMLERLTIQKWIWIKWLNMAVKNLG
jgi:hypothetical protein